MIDRFKKAYLCQDFVIFFLGLMFVNLSLVAVLGLLFLFGNRPLIVDYLLMAIQVCSQAIFIGYLIYRWMKVGVTKPPAH